MNREKNHDETSSQNFRLIVKGGDVNEETEYVYFGLYFASINGLPVNTI